MKVDILGVEYTIKFSNYDEHEDFKKFDWAGWCNEISKEIVICNMKTFPNLENEKEEYLNKLEKTNLRHEIIHAYLNESGLSSCSSGTNCWAKNEEMVDWIAIQSPKIFKTFKQAKCL